MVHSHGVDQFFVALRVAHDSQNGGRRLLSLLRALAALLARRAPQGRIRLDVAAARLAPVIGDEGTYGFPELPWRSRSILSFDSGGLPRLGGRRRHQRENPARRLLGTPADWENNADDEEGEDIIRSVSMRPFY